MRHLSTIAAALAVISTACAKGDAKPVTQTDSAHTGHGAMTSATQNTQITVPNDTTLPADAAGAVARLNASPRHGEYVMIPTAKGDSLRAWVVYPARSSKAPVVVVIHEIFGLSSWVRAVGDQLAASGYIAIVPDFLTGQKLPGAPDSIAMQDGMAAISKLNKSDVQRGIDAAAAYAMGLPSALPRYGIVGFCWGGNIAFEHAIHSPSLKAAVVYYGPTPKTDSLSAISAPVLGLYGGNDARVVTSIPPADSAMKALGKTFEHHIYDGAEHGFARNQSGANGANLNAIQQAWPATLVWFKKYLGA
jgi:carboxymethylenebutenolidase